MGDLEKCGREYFERLPSLFIQRFEETLKAHTSRWRSQQSVPIIIAGNPVIAKHFLRWLFHGHLPPNEEVEMEHHYMNSETQTVNILDCIKWLTHDFTLDREEMQYNRLIDDLMDELRVISESDATIDLLDKETWGEHDFTRAYELIWNAIALRAAHQQRVENLVQTAGFLGKTKVEEVRRSARAKIHCIFYRDFKTWSLAILRKKTDRENEERMQQLT
jgi:hypothetical protein